MKDYREPLWNSLHEGSLEITRTVPLGIYKFDKSCI